jgi:hypothetical protein
MRQFRRFRGGAGTRNVVEHVRDEETNDLVGYFGDDPGDPVIVPAGSIARFSTTVFHRSGPNTTDRMRRVYVAQYTAEPLLSEDRSRPACLRSLYSSTASRSADRALRAGAESCISTPRAGADARAVSWGELESNRPGRFQVHRPRRAHLLSTSPTPSTSWKTYRACAPDPEMWTDVEISPHLGLARPSRN